MKKNSLNGTILIRFISIIINVLISSLVPVTDADSVRIHRPIQQ